MTPAISWATRAGSTVAGDSTNAMAGDIQINGPGVLEVLGGRNIDLGTGANFIDGTGVGITSIGNIRNPNLPFAGADIIALAGVTAAVAERTGPRALAAVPGHRIFISTYLARTRKVRFRTTWKSSASTEISTN